MMCGLYLSCLAQLQVVLKTQNMYLRSVSHQIYSF